MSILRGGSDFPSVVTVDVSGLVDYMNRRVGEIGQSIVNSQRREDEAIAEVQRLRNGIKRALRETRGCEPVAGFMTLCGVLEELL